MQQAASKDGWFAAAGVLAQRLRGARELRSHERRFVSDALNDLVRGLRRLRHLSARSAEPPRGAPKTSAKSAKPAQGAGPGALALYLAYLCELHDQHDLHNQGAGEARLPKALLSTAGAAGLDTRALLARMAVLRADEARLPELAADGCAEQDGAGARDAAITRLGEVLSYPDWIVRAMLSDLGPVRGLAVLRAQNRRAPLTARANLLRCTREELAARLAAEGVVSERSELAPLALLLQTRVNAYGLAAFQDGWFELMDEGSQLIAELVSPAPGEVVVDACAGAGGKALALGARMQNRGRLLAFDIDRDKLDELRRRARRAGLTNVQALCTSMDGTGELPAELFSRGAAKVLVDAPCSGLGVLRRNPEARWRLRPADLDEIGAKQRAILMTAASLVQPGGLLVYATCTVLRRENDEVVEDLLRQRSDFSIVPAAELLGRDLAERAVDGPFLRTLPGEATSPGATPDGFFAAALRRRG
jgi:16S rRNA (cytosine967-C5)-methyltransferase